MSRPRTTTAARCYRAAVSPDLLTPGVIVNQTDPTALWQHLVQWQPATAAALAQHIRALPDDWPLRVFGVGRPDAALTLPPGAAGEQFPDRAPEIAPYDEIAPLDDCPACTEVEGTCRWHEGYAAGHHEAVQAQLDAVRVNPGMGLREFMRWQADVEEAEDRGEEPPAMPAAVPAVQSPADPTAEVEQLRADVEHWQRMYNAEHARHVAVVGALVTDRAAVRAETLREAADRYASLIDQNEAYELAEHGSIDHESRLQFEAVRDVVAGLRRLAGEQPTNSEAPRCANPGCGHPKRDHDGRTDHRETYSPLVAGEPWCHACNAECDYADEEQSAPDLTERKEQYAVAIHDAMESDLSLVDQEPGYQALIARAAEAAMALADAEAQQPTTETEAAATLARECVDRPAVIRWCADRVRSTDGDYAVLAAAEYLDDLATEIEEAAETAPAPAEQRPAAADDEETRCTCADAGACFAPAGHYADCPLAEHAPPSV